jgi:carbon-monoxide dehydrogenase medium subunit
MPRGEYVLHRPQTIAEACALGLEHGHRAAYLAGGTELLVDLRSGRKSVAHVIALGGLQDLQSITVRDDELAIGALCPLSDVAASSLVREFYAPLSEAILTMAGVQIRNLGTMGGNFCCAVPCSDTPPISIVAGAELVIAGPDGERRLPAHEFHLAPRVTVLQPGEILREIRIPAQPAASGASYQRFGLRRGMSLSVAAVAARLVLSGDVIADARIVLSSVGPVPLSAERAAAGLTGQPPGEEAFAAAGKIAAEEAQPITDLRGSEQYRRDLVQVMTTRALTVATERAQGGTA